MIYCDILCGWQHTGSFKQNRTFQGSILLLESLPWLIRPLFGGFPQDRLVPSTKNWIGFAKGLMIPSRFCVKGIIFFFLCFSFFSFQVCEQLLKGIVYPLAVKSTQVLKTSSPKRARCSGVFGSSSLPLPAHFHSLLCVCVREIFIV